MIASVLAALLLPAATSRASPGATPATKALSSRSPFPAPAAGTCGGAADPALQDSEFFPYIAANPSDPNNLIAAWIQDDARANLVASSVNGGHTWKTVPLPGINDCTGNAEYQLTLHPELSFGPLDGPDHPYGRAYAISSVGSVLPGSSEICSVLGCGEVPDNSAILVNTSDDGGRTWSAPSRPSLPSRFPAASVQDPHITAHPRNTKVAYATWLEFNGGGESTVRLARTGDGALTWGIPGIVAASTTPGRFVAPAGVQVLNDSSLVAVYVEADLLPSPPVRGPVEIWAVQSSDEGTRWSLPVMIASISGSVVVDPDTGETLWLNFQIPEIAVGPEGLYVVWHEVTNGPAPSARIRLATSLDGRVWTTTSAPVVQSNAQVFAPRISIDRSGTLGVAFYDFRNDRPGDDDLTTDLWIRHSHDDGESWEEDRLVGPFDIRAAPRFFGLWVFYPGLAGLSSGFVSVSSHLGGDDSSTNVFYTALKLPASLR